MIFGLYTVALFCTSTFVSSVLMPMQIMNIVQPENKTTTLGIITFIASVIALPVGPIVGYFSDRAFRFGKRKPYIFAGTLLMTVSLVAMGALGNYGTTHLLLFSLMAIFNTAALSMSLCGLTALVPDLVPASQIAIVSSAVAFSNLLGMLAGISFFGMLYGAAHALVTSIIVGVFLMVSCVILLVSFTERAEPPEPLTPEQVTMGKIKSALVAFARPFKQRNFLAMFVSRFLFTVGFSTMQTYFLYYFIDRFHKYDFFMWDNLITTGTQAQSVFGGVLLFGALITALLGAKISAMFGKKQTICATGCLEGVCAALLIVMDSFTLTVIIGLFMGLGMGAHFAVEFSLVNHVVDNGSSNEAAKDLSLWQLSNQIPQILAAPIGTVLLLIGGKHLIRGYQVMFGVCALLEITASLIMLLVKETTEKQVQVEETTTPEHSEYQIVIS